MSTQYIIDDVLLCKTSTLVISVMGKDGGQKKRNADSHLGSRCWYEDQCPHHRWFHTPWSGTHIHIKDAVHLFQLQTQLFIPYPLCLCTASEKMFSFIVFHSLLNTGHSLCLCICAVPNRDSTVGVDVFHCLNICIQLRVAVQVSSTAPL